MESKQDRSLSLKETLYAVGYGIQRSLGILIEYPLECIKTRWQVYPEIKSFWSIVAYSYRKYGFLGFYNGLIPSAARKIPMQAYRWPLLLQLPEYYENHLYSKNIHQDVDKHAKIILTNFFTAVTIAVIETFLAAPIEACKLDLIVNRDSTKSILQYLRKGHSLKSHYLGVDALLSKEILGWVSFLVSCNLFRQLLKDYNQDKKMQWYQLAGLSLGVGCINATAIMPADVIRSQMQKQSTQDVSLVEVAKSIVKKQGIVGLYRGWRIRFFQMSVATALSVPVMEQFEAQKLSLLNQ